MSETRLPLRYEIARLCAEYWAQPPQPAQPAARATSNKECWWDDVLNDPRARVSRSSRSIPENNSRARDRLDRQHPTISIACEACLRRTTVERADAITMMGADANIHWAVRELVDCGHRDKVNNYCRAYVVR